MSGNFDLSMLDFGSSENLDGFLEKKGSDGSVHTASEMLRQNPLTPTKPFPMESVQGSAAPGLDALFASNPQLAVPAKPGRVRLASVQQLSPFIRVSADTLVHKSDRELWALRKEADGAFYIERLFDDNGSPLKG